MKSLLVKALVFICGFSTLAFNAHAAFTNAKCEHVLTGSGNIQINRQWDSQKRLCFLAIGPRNVVDLKYRDYYFDNAGQFMIFNSYGDGPSETDTATRDFYLFPITLEYPDYSIEPNGDVIVKMVSGHELRLSAIDFSIVSFSPGTFTEKPLSAKNQGGVEISPSVGFWVDGGFKLGGVGFDSPSAKSTIKSALSSDSCSLANKEFLGYASDGNYGFKYFNTDLKNLFIAKCPQLKF